jgi:lysophospholipase L1-like esterase
MYHQLKRLAVLLVPLLLAACSGPSGPRVDLSDQVIVAFGDSVTSGVGDSARLGGYPFRLEQMLAASFPNVVVRNQGVPGERTQFGVIRLSRVLAREQPDIVLIMEGINNVALDPLPSIAQDLLTMVQMVKASGAIPVIATLTPTTGSHIGKNGGVIALNALIANIAAQEDIPLVDLYTAFTDQPDFSLLLNEDGLHPNSMGYQLMAETWLDGLLNQL